MCGKGMLASGDIFYAIARREQLRIWIVSTRFGRVERAVLTLAKQRGHESSFFYPHDIPLKFYDGKMQLQIADYVIPDVCLLRRTRYHFEAAVSIGLFLEKAGAVVIDPLPTIVPPISKIVELIRLPEGTAYPSTTILWQCMSNMPSIERFSLPVFIKTTDGWSGQGTRMINDHFTLEEVIGEWKEANNGSNLMIQEAISGVELRVAVVDQNAWVSEKSCIDIVRSERHGTQYLPVNDTEAAEHAVRICKGLGIRIGGVDFIRDDKGMLWLLECNRNPGFPLNEQFDQIISAIVNLIENEKKV